LEAPEAYPQGVHHAFGLLWLLACGPQGGYFGEDLPGTTG
jgi:hypothetical protein